MSEHTPGPWIYSSGAAWAYGDADTGICVAQRASTANLPPVEKDANLRFMAAAPELLANLELAESWLTSILNNGPMAGLKDVVDFMPNNWRGVYDMREAIAKAKGQL